MRRQRTCCKNVMPKGEVARNRLWPGVVMEYWAARSEQSRSYRKKQATRGWTAGGRSDMYVCTE